MSASENRRLSETVSVRLLPVEKKALLQEATRRGMSLKELLLDGVRPILSDARIADLRAEAQPRAS